VPDVAETSARRTVKMHNMCHAPDWAKKSEKQGFSQPGASSAPCGYEQDVQFLKRITEQ
jgi:hypothetical protein